MLNLDHAVFDPVAWMCRDVLLADNGRDQSITALRNAPVRWPASFAPSDPFAQIVAK